MNRKFLFVVPSRERAHWLKGRMTNTLETFKGKHKPMLYVREDDSQLDAYAAMAESYGVKLMIQDATALGAAQTYDSLINYGIAMGFERLVILDDDLFFKMHNPILGMKPDFVKLTPHMADVLVEHFAELTCPEMPAMSMNPIMTRSYPTRVNYATSLMWTYSFYLPHFKAHPEHRYWQGKHIEARCDLNLALSILTSGYLTGRMVTCFIPDNVNNPGGCSTYRTLDLEKQSVDYLVKTYPGFVKTHKQWGWVGDEDVERLAPKVAWKKAFNRKAFAKHFDKDVGTFIGQHLAAYEIKYADFIKELRA